MCLSVVPVCEVTWVDDRVVVCEVTWIDDRVVVCEVTWVDDRVVVCDDITTEGIAEPVYSKIYR